MDEEDDGENFYLQQGCCRKQPSRRFVCGGTSTTARAETFAPIEVAITDTATIRDGFNASVLYRRGCPRPPPAGTPRFIQVVAGPRQVGKTTLTLQVSERAAPPHQYASADEPTLRSHA